MKNRGIRGPRCPSTARPGWRWVGACGRRCGMRRLIKLRAAPRWQAGDRAGGRRGLPGRGRACLARDRFPGLEFPDLDPDAFASRSRSRIARRLRGEDWRADPVWCRGDIGAKERGQGGLPRRGVGWGRRRPLRRRRDRAVPATRHPADRSRRRGSAVDPLQRLPQSEELPDGNVLVVGAGSSGVQIADELRQSGRRVFLSSARMTGPREGTAGATSSGGLESSACGTLRLLP